MTPTNDAPVTVEQCDREAAAAIHRHFCAYTEATDVANGRAEGDYVLGIVARHRLAALASAPAEPAWHTDLGGLIEARRVAQAAYKAIERAKAQNTHIPGNPYDVALAALNPALGMLAVLVEQPDSAPAADGVKPWEGANPVEQGVYDHFMSGSQRGYLYDSVRRGRLNVAKPDRADGTQFAAWMAGRHLAEREALARPRAAVGEREAAFDPVAYGARVLATMGDQSCRPVAAAIGISPATLNRVTRGGMPDVPTLYAIDHWLALQSPPAKVEG